MTSIWNTSPNSPTTTLLNTACARPDAVIRQLTAGGMWGDTTGSAGNNGKYVIGAIGGNCLFPNPVGPQKDEWDRYTSDLRTKAPTVALIIHTVVTKLFNATPPTPLTFSFAGGAHWSVSYTPGYRHKLDIRGPQYLPP